MKRFSLFIGCIFMFMLSLSASAQSKNFFTGKWNVLVEGTPQGDAKMILVFEDKDGKPSGYILDPATKKEVSKLNKVELKGDTVSVYFTSQGYEVYLFLEKENEHKASGSMMDMFDATADRIKE
ncbi:hypothetical protein [Flavobacterium psychrotrophum]|uniref:hypothetical protein n=1 Tax=Flavobacterium psychrotrophum TaxID=2294119 RepID=UPI0013C4D713|nr:hypothetical protein [Flavobacterium psychrotrophum]